MDALTIAALTEQLILQLAPLAVQAIQAEKAGDQAALDKIHRQVVAASNAMKPEGAPDVPVLDAQ